MIELVKWDTENLGIKVGNLRWDEAVDATALRREMAKAQSEGYDLLYLKGIELSEDCLFDNVVLADEKVEYTQTISDNQMTSYPDGHVVSILNHPLTEELLQLSYESGKYSRYHLDKNMPSSVFETLYGLWIKRSLNGEIAIDVLGYVDNGRILGILTYRQKDNEVTIGIIAVDSQSSGQGIGTKLMQSFLASLPVGTKVNVATQKCNEIACHYYEKNGFHVEDVTNIYHIWL